MQGGRTFQPDYYRHDHTTHYFRINHIKDPTVELKMALSANYEKLRHLVKAITQSKFRQTNNRYTRGRETNENISSDRNYHFYLCRQY